MFNQGHDRCQIANASQIDANPSPGTGRHIIERHLDLALIPDDQVEPGLGRTVAPFVEVELPKGGLLCGNMLCPLGAGLHLLERPEHAQRRVDVLPHCRVTPIEPLEGLEQHGQERRVLNLVRLHPLGVGVQLPGNPGPADSGRGDCDGQRALTLAHGGDQHIPELACRPRMDLVREQAADRQPVLAVSLMRHRPER
jgi:hypothetical protein